MDQISLYLKKFEKLEIKGDALKKQIIEIVKKTTNIVLEKDDIFILKNGVIKINKLGPQKALIFLNKEKIEKEMNKIII